jgi:hypothetical protein
VDAGKYEREAGEMSDTEAVVENDAQQADIALRTGLEGDGAPSAGTDHLRHPTLHGRRGNG